jgi:hypothetical protein
MKNLKGPTKGMSGESNEWSMKEEDLDGQNTLELEGIHIPYAYLLLARERKRKTSASINGSRFKNK